MRNWILQNAPQEFDRQFLQWLRHLEKQLLVRLADWHPSPMEEVLRYAEAIKQDVPKALELYYDNAYPFGLLKQGWYRWHLRRNEYQATWVRYLVHELGVGFKEAEAVVNASPPIWPIDCLERKKDIVGFIWQGEQLAVIELDPGNWGGARPISIGLRSYFLTNILLEVLAEDEISVDFDTLRQHPAVIQASGWPGSVPQPKHISLTISGSG